MLTCPQVVWRAVIGQVAQLIGAEKGENETSLKPF